MTTAEQIRSIVQTGREAAQAGHRGGASGAETCAALTGSMDAAIRTAFESLTAEQRRHLTVLALGGYGRAELFPWSDVDVMILYERGNAEDAARAGARDLLHTLWDAGLQVGHSVRTPEETLALRGSVLDAWTGVLESRPVCGDPKASGHLAAMLTHPGHVRWFVDGILADIANRLERFGSSVKLLEPNLKKSAGGLRDLHGAFWLYRACEDGFSFPMDASAPATHTFAALLRERGTIDDEQYRKLMEAVAFLFRARHEMHFQRDAQHDTLEYILQNSVAEALGFGRKAELHSVEVFMREYYLHARTVHRTSARLVERFRGGHGATTSRETRHELGNGLWREGDVLVCDPLPERFTEPDDVLKVFSLAAETELDLHGSLQHAVEKSVGLFGPDVQSSPGLAALFRRILRSSRVSETLRAMNDLGILGAYIPEWGELVAFFQHNVYHYYTADEHTLIAVANAEALRLARGPLRDVYRHLGRKDLLYLGILLHDIAKPRGVADHEITGVEMSRNVLRRLGMEGDAEEVGFLIRHHLAMEQIAFRRNLHDPSTIREFAARFDRPELLSYLYVLTYADLSAVNPSVWTDWKAAMLQELYQRTLEVLIRNLRGDQIDRYHRARAEAAAEKVVESLSTSMSREDVQRHLDGFQDDAYVAAFTEREIHEHIKRRTAGALSVLFEPAGGFTEVTVIAPDAPFALSRCCAVLTANDASIIDANIFTHADGVLIDRFRVTDAATSGALSGEVCGKIREDLRRVLGGSLDIEHLFQEHRRRWRRRPKPPVNPNTRTDVQFEETPRQTIIDVYAPDSLGFLYRVTETISSLGMDIYSAKIATRVDGIIDAFYVLDRDGGKITDPERQAAVREEILSTLDHLARETLGRDTTQGQQP